jgi:endonuclease-3
MDVIEPVIRGIKRQIKSVAVPSVTVVSRQRHDPYLVLVSCILSLRTKDKTTLDASERLFALADAPVAMSGLTVKQIAAAIYPVGFYRTKAKVIRDISRRLCTDYDGVVPRTQAELLSFKGVGLKTANLVLGLGFGIPAICVDTHVHRIANRLGWVRTAAAEETERALRRVLPRKYWIEINTDLVAFGQNFCQPVSPRCGGCFVRRDCKRVGVVKSR